MPTNETIKRFKEGILELKLATPWHKKFGRLYRLKMANMKGLLDIAIKIKEKHHLLSDEQHEKILFYLKKMNQETEDNAIKARNRGTKGAKKGWNLMFYLMVLLGLLCY